MKKRFMTIVLAIGTITASNAQIDANNNANLEDVYIDGDLTVGDATTLNNTNITGDLTVDGEATFEELYIETLDVGVISTNYIYNSKGLFLKYDSTVSQLSFGRADDNYNSTINTANDNTLEFRNTSGGGSFDFLSNIEGKGTRSAFYIDGSKGNVGIGTTSPDSPLTVNGKIHATEVLVDTNIFADYVFKSDYELKSLEQVENYIATKGHLEGFKSEKEIVKEGLNLKETTIKQQEKIEELTLYLIELSKEVKSLKAQLKK